MFSFKIVIPLLGIRDPELKVMNMHVFVFILCRLLSNSRGGRDQVDFIYRLDGFSTI